MRGSCGAASSATRAVERVGPWLLGVREGHDVIAGVTIGTTLIGGGGMRTVATGTLLGIHGSHRHDGRATIRAAPGDLAIRF